MKKMETLGDAIYGNPHLNNYFDFHVCLSIQRPFFRPFVRPFVRPSVCPKTN